LPINTIFNETKLTWSIATYKIYSLNDVYLGVCLIMKLHLLILFASKSVITEFIEYISFIITHLIECMSVINIFLF
jgi:hypothetical protein